MSEEAEQNAETKESPGKSGSKGLVVVVLVAAVVLGGGAAAAGAIVAVRFASGSAAPAPQPSAAEEEQKALLSAEFQPIIVDLRANDGVQHHLKVSLAAELPTGVAKEEFEAAVPRGREAAITYLRGLSYDEATSPQGFSRLKTELAKHVIEAMGEKRVAALLITDFVSQ